MAFSVAVEEAQKSNYSFKNGSTFRLGAVVLKKKKIISRGFNQRVTHPKMFHKFGFNSLHAECAALLRANKGDTLIVVRILKNGELACSKPCEKCMKCIKEFGIKKVVYIDWEQKVVEKRV